MSPRFLLALVLAAPLAAGSAHAATLDTVKTRGAVRCGVSTGFPGFSLPDSQGVYRGLDVDVCRSVAASVFGDATKVQFVPLTAVQRFTALQSGEVDLLARNATWTYARSAQLGLTFTAVNYYDGTAFMVTKTSPAKSARDLNGATICAQAGTETLLGVQDYFSRNGLKFAPVTFENVDTMKSAFVGGRCDAMTSDSTQLMGIRSTLPTQGDYRLLPEVVTKEPLSPAVKSGDDQWANIVRWSFWAMVNAEEMGLTSQNVKAEAGASTDPNVQRFVGKTGDLGKMLGLEPAWALNVVAQVGNYGESFARNLGPLGVDRGLNRLWRDGGLMFAPPLR
ncbi:amino acid ABC transporter substrate-binding protein, PAAT family (TC 3.A.1.3.-) [Enhydrobacter aerosaccus]|uniref:Amino acid ABC transporter substrate-binding protein, PAAT family (TC 3.A.1.3.-) n=1 Tax=Enhydrobacter aerosaccus TaxID=225324 RepID=A0A1T4RYT4_9HYPH|nr:amino acid ABC transporter substrate-binding protein [Enhydrobacter aerosaccus]SKA21105.1 amino acid ABC transporter substrate-binding protein, PAAT family (TC 3.A.1.3.-) [Enhydrobacter aerosaccus]